MNIEEPRQGMNKTEYLALPEVAQFTEFLRSGLLADSGQFEHAYDVESKGRSEVTTPWSCDSIYDAFLKYDWQYTYQDPCTGEKHTGSTFAESELVLSLLSKRLKKQWLKKILQRPTIVVRWCLTGEECWAAAKNPLSPPDVSGR